MRLPQNTELALARCLDAVADPGIWGLALQALSDSLGSDSCTLCSGELQQLSAVVMPVSTEHVEFAERWRRNQPYAPDPHFRLGKRPACARSAVVLEHQFSTDEERRTLPYYHETARPAHREWSAISKFEVGKELWWLSVYRSDERGPFTPDDALRLAMVAPRLVPTVSMAVKFSCLQVDSHLLGLEKARCPAFAIDARGKVLSMNHKAEDLLEKGLHILGRRLSTSDPSANYTLQQFVSKAIAARSAETCVPEPVIIRGSGEERYLVEAIPTTGDLSAFFSKAWILLLVTSLEAQGGADNGVLRNGFRLTAAEARLAGVLASGQDLASAASLLGIKMSTARSQLGALFGKTDTRRQAELVALLTRLPRS